jgi:hypothetical protein
MANRQHSITCHYANPLALRDQGFANLIRICCNLPQLVAAGDPQYAQ